MRALRCTRVARYQVLIICVSFIARQVGGDGDFLGAGIRRAGARLRSLGTQGMIRFCASFFSRAVLVPCHRHTLPHHSFFRFLFHTKHTMPSAIPFKYHASFPWVMSTASCFSIPYHIVRHPISTPVLYIPYRAIPPLLWCGTM